MSNMTGDISRNLNVYHSGVPKIPRILVGSSCSNLKVSNWWNMH